MSKQRPNASEMMSISELSQAAAKCRLCRLHRDRRGVVTGEGPHDAEVFMLSDVPTYHDDLSGRLFSGPEAELFAQCLSDAGLKREDVYLTAAVKCHTPMSRSPFPDEIEACEGWLFRELSLIKPRIIVTFGTLPMRLVTGRRQQQLQDVCGTLMHTSIQGDDVVVWPLLSPKAVIHVPSLLKQMQKDAKALGFLVHGVYSDKANSQSSDQSSAQNKDQTSTQNLEQTSTPSDQPSAGDEGSQLSLGF